jgi:hypothetical protein
MSSHSVQENDKVGSTEDCQKRTKIEHERATRILWWHVQLAEGIRMEEDVRLSCNALLCQHGFTPAKKKAALIGRHGHISSDMSDEEVHRTVWYGMNAYQSKFSPLMLDVADNG